MTIPGGLQWPQCEAGASATQGPFSWIRIHNRGTVDVVVDFAAIPPIQTTDILNYWERVPAGKRLVRNVGGVKPDRAELPPNLGGLADDLPLELYVRNVDPATAATVMVEVSDSPIIDFLLGP
jgi:hypothetical protein